MNTSIAIAQNNEIDSIVTDELAALRSLEDIELFFVGGGDVVQMGG
jgi:hypothetical protein